MLNLWRKERRRAQREVSFNATAETPLPDALGGGNGRPSGGADPETEVMKKSFLMAVDQALRKLPSDLQITVILADIEGFTYQEMADILRCPLGTIMSRLHRARRCLEREMNAFAERTGEERAQR